VDQPEAKDACVNIAPINPLSHHGSVLVTFNEDAKNLEIIFVDNNIGIAREAP
jgi:hypothetical protein